MDASVKQAPGNRGLFYDRSDRGKLIVKVSGELFFKICGLTSIHGNIGIGIFLYHDTKRRAKMKKISLILVVFAFSVYCASEGQSQEVSPKLGDNAPDFSLVDDSGKEIRLGDFKGKKNVALVFYAQHS